MTRYLLSVHTPVGEPQMPMNEEQMREGSARIFALAALSGERRGSRSPRFPCP